MIFRYSKSYFDIRTESENRILTLKILFWHSNWVGKWYFDIILFWHSNWVGNSYFDIKSPNLTFELTRKMLFWYSKFYFDIWTELENRILTFKILCWHSNWVGKCYLYIQNYILTFELCRKIVIFVIQNPILTFELSRKMLFWHSKSYFDIRTESENAILIF